MRVHTHSKLRDIGISSEHKHSLRKTSRNFLSPVTNEMRQTGVTSPDIPPSVEPRYNYTDMTTWHIHQAILSYYRPTHSYESQTHDIFVRLEFCGLHFHPHSGLFLQSPSTSHRSKERVGSSKIWGGKVARGGGGGKKMPSYKYSRKTMAFPSRAIEPAHT